MNILQAAEKIINGDRAKAYGSPLVSCTKIATLWGVVLNCEITPEQVAMCMIQLKIVREMNRHQKDNIIDIAGYAGIMEKIIKEKSDQEWSGRSE